MDKELEIKRQFLDEAQDYLNDLDAAFMGIADRKVDAARINAALRAAHSIKGGAGMMGFMTLSELAHRIEDSLKVLKVQPDRTVIDNALEGTALNAVKAMREVADRSRMALMTATTGATLVTIDPQWLEKSVFPLFSELRDRLGDPVDEDAHSMMGGGLEEGQDILPMIFETEVEGCLVRLESVLADPQQPCLREEVTILAQELGGLGEMLQLSAFSSLCESVLGVTASCEDAQVTEVAVGALESWRLSQALVLTGQLGDLPTILPGFDAWANDTWASPTTEDLTTDGLAEWDAVMAAATAELMTDINDWDTAAMTGDQTIAELPIDKTTQRTSEFVNQSTNELVNPEWMNLNGESWGSSPVDQAIVESSVEPTFKTVEPTFKTTVEPALEPVIKSAVGFVGEPVGEPVSEPVSELFTMERVVPTVSSTPMMPDPMVLPEESDENATVRVSLKQLNQLNDLFGELAIERNGLDLYLKRLSSLMTVLGDRVKQLDQTNIDVRTLYDRSASGTSTRSDSASGSTSIRLGSYSDAVQGSVIAEPQELNLAYSKELRPDFDELELDRYGELHSLSQQIMETVVQIQEVTSDLDLSIDDATQTTRNLNKTAKQLQSKLTQLRMRPLGDITGRFPRALREMALQYGKRVRLNVIGSNLLIDRNILESLNDPLMHLLRNAFDHGIETPEARRAIGKPDEGVITIEALHRGNRTEICVRDDGSGIPLHKVRNRAEQMGLDAGLLATASDADLLALIFEPGFSTSDSVTALSGRGVGMDVVRDNLKQIRGEISVNTQSGIGTTFTLSLPYTLSIVRILLAESQGMVLGLPNDAIESVMLFQPESVMIVGAQERVQVSGERLPLIRLGEWLNFNCARQPQSLENTPTINAPTLLIARRGIEKVALLIDRCWGEQEVALRRIEAPLTLPPGFSGCTILGDGRVVPLANLSELLHWISTYGSRSSDRPDMPISNLTPVRSAVKPTVLIVDDSINVRRFLALTLERSGYRVEQAKDGQDAIDKLENGLAVSAVICDIEMPRLDGFGVLNRLRSNASLRHLPVALLTSRSGDKYRKLSTSLGAAAYLTKPYSEQDLLKTLQHMLTLVSV